MTKLIIAGGRDFDDYTLLKKALSKLPKPDEIICGKARGADTLGEDYAMDQEITIVKFPADWDRYGKAAGHIRNRRMADYADILLVFWDGKSTGTKSMIEKMNRQFKPVILYLY